MTKEVTTTGAIAGRGTYFPNRRPRKKDKGSPMMNEAKLAVMLVERYGLSHRAALRVVLEGDAEAAGKMIAKKEAPEDPKKQEKLAKDYKEAIKKQMDNVNAASDDDAEKEARREAARRKEADDEKEARRKEARRQREASDDDKDDDEAQDDDEARDDDEDKDEADPSDDDDEK